MSNPVLDDFYNWLIQNGKAKSTASNYKSWVKRLLNNPFPGNLNSDTASALRAFNEFLNIYRPVLNQNNTNIVSKLSGRNTHRKLIIDCSGVPFNPPRGPDEDQYFVKYDDDIPDSEKVEGLALILAEEYSDIRNFSLNLLRSLGFDTKRQVAGNDGFIPVILKKGHPVSKHYFSDDDIKALLLNKCTKSNDGRISADEIHSILNTGGIAMRVAGQYCGGDRPHIEIFYENISASNWDEYIMELKHTLAHEYMHYCHECLVGYQMFNERTSTCTNLKEAIADFFAALYLAEHIYGQTHDRVCLNSIKDRFHFWRKYFGTSIPYVNALYFFYVCKRLIDIENDFLVDPLYCGVVENFKTVLSCAMLSNRVGFDELKSLKY